MLAQNGSAVAEVEKSIAGRRVATYLRRLSTSIRRARFRNRGSLPASRARVGERNVFGRSDVLVS